MTIQIASHRIEITHRHHVRRANRRRALPRTGIAPDVVVCLGVCASAAAVLAHVLTLIAGGGL